MSVKKWKNLRRNQQELVLKVWDEVLQKIKWKAAKSPGDFGMAPLTGLHGPRELPFDVAIEALKEIAGGTPQFEHNCPGCVYLGQYMTGPPLEQEDKRTAIKIPGLEEPKEKTTNYDLYWCNQGGQIKEDAFTARYGTKDDNTADLKSNASSILDINRQTRSDFDPQLTSKDRPDHPAINEARRRAAERGLLHRTA